MNPFESLVAPLLKAYPGLEAADIQFKPPPKLDLGDVAVPMFLPARKLKAPPPKIAQEAAERVEFGEEVLAAEAAGPYLNLKLDRSAFARAFFDRVRARRSREEPDGDGDVRRNGPASSKP